MVGTKPLQVLATKYRHINENKGKPMIPSFIITFFLFLFTTPEKVYDVFRVSHPMHVLLAETMDTERFKATCIINLSEKRTNLNMNQTETEKPRNSKQICYASKEKIVRNKST